MFVLVVCLYRLILLWLTIRTFFKFYTASNKRSTYNQNLFLVWWWWWWWPWCDTCGRYAPIIPRGSPLLDSASAIVIKRALVWILSCDWSPPWWWWWPWYPAWWWFMWKWPMWPPREWRIWNYDVIMTHLQWRYTYHWCTISTTVATTTITTRRWVVNSAVYLSPITLFMLFFAWLGSFISISCYFLRKYTLTAIDLLSKIWLS